MQGTGREAAYITERGLGLHPTRAAVLKRWRGVVAIGLLSVLACSKSNTSAPATEDGEAEGRPEPAEPAELEAAATPPCPPAKLVLNGQPFVPPFQRARVVEKPDTLKAGWPTRLGHVVTFSTYDLECASYLDPSGHVVPREGFSFDVIVNPATKQTFISSTNTSIDTDLEVVEKPEAQDHIAICVRTPTTLQIEKSWMGEAKTLEVSGLLRAKSCGTVPREASFGKRGEAYYRSQAGQL